mgnify:CR=1 FL=1
MTVDIGLFVSLLFVVVIEIGGIARSLDLERISEEKLPPFFIGLFYLLDTGSQQQQVTIPQLGRFNFLHGANLAILFIGYALVTETTTGLTGFLISLVTFVVWALTCIGQYRTIITCLLSQCRQSSCTRTIPFGSLSSGHQYLS